MNEITSALRVADAARKTIRLLDIVRKAAIITASVVCGMLALIFCYKLKG